MKNIKDTLSTIFGIVGVVGGVLMAIPTFPTWVGGAMVASSAGVIGVLTGKNPNGASKGIEQIDLQNTLSK